MMEQLEGRDRRMEGPPLASFHLAEQRGSRWPWFGSRYICKKDLFFQLCLGVKDFERRGRSCCPLRCPESWFSYLVMETAQGQPRGLPGDGGRAQQEPPIILVGTETEGVSATL